MTKPEMQAILVLENMKSILRQRADYQQQFKKNYGKYKISSFIEK